MTPAIRLLEKLKVPFTPHPYAHDEGAASFGLEAAEKLGVDRARVFKTLVARLDARGDLVVAVVPVAGHLSLKALASAAKGKKAELAEPAAAERATGYVVGGISPLGMRKRLATFVDASAMGFETVYFSAGRRGLQIEVAPADLVRAAGATVARIAAE
jgi:Cys-tRNA(Pro)/Cys-tRNA(Cys) deacylase